MTDIGTHRDYLGELLIPGVMASFALPFGFIPSTIVATTGVKPQEAGLASAVVNTARLFGGALGLAVLATLATSRSAHELAHPTAAIHTANQALVSGFQLAFWIGAAVAAVGILVAVIWVPSPQRAKAEQTQAAVAVEM
jgi:hypothetical protein